MPDEMQHDPRTAPSGTRHLSDEELVFAFESCRLANEDFRHYDHIRLAWVLLGGQSLDGATARMVRAIRAFAMHHHGDVGKYHDTITRLWMRLVAHAMSQGTAYGTFDAFAAANPQLLNKAYPFEFFSEARLMSGDARAGWLEPDLRPLPTERRSPARERP
jgi:hypothetical protein